MKENKGFKLLLLSIISSCIFCLGCKSNITDSEEMNIESNAVYYWRTTLETDSIERDFLRVNNVRRAYVRFFDIVVDKSPIAMDSVVPNATLQVKDSIPVGQIIPTVFITPEAMNKMKSNEAIWAEKIVKRIFNMCSYNELGEPTEIQLDCDWTAHNDSAFFSLCRAVKEQLRERHANAGTQLSATIRLHQLSQTPPPVDYGVLMLYNTGSFKDPDEVNSIISVENIKPYLKYLPDYTLPLDYAYPIFSWNLIYDDYRFKGLINSKHKIPSSVLKKVADGKYQVIKDTVINDIYLYYGDIVRQEEASFKTIMEVKHLIEPFSPESRGAVVLYSLDSQNISNFSDDEFKEIYN